MWTNERGADRKEEEDHEAPEDALDGLRRLMLERRPETWADLPESELIALDAPTERLALTFADGTEYVLSDDREGAGEVLWLARCFMESYTVVGARTYELVFPEPESGEAAYTVTLSAPETVWVSDGMASGADRAGCLVFHGRVPGRTELTIEGPPEDGEGGRRTCVLEVDNAYNVTCVEER